MKTSYFTFGQSHRHVINGKKFDKDVVVKITADNPRVVMGEIFGFKWSMEYDEHPSPELFPGGVVEIP